APVIVLKKSREENRLGGAANVALNLKMLGADIKLIGSVGKDKNARNLKKLLKSNKIDTLLSESENIVTIHKNRIVSDQQQIIRIDVEDKILVSFSNDKKPCAKPSGIQIESSSFDDNSKLEYL
ncbi:PfkB family carbohydrate kinase, partial [bacterium]|nr:PfkB family carbohydrate kinase [bacterium]